MSTLVDRRQQLAQQLQQAKNDARELEDQAKTKRREIDVLTGALMAYNEMLGRPGDDTTLVDFSQIGEAVRAWVGANRATRRRLKKAS